MTPKPYEFKYETEKQFDTLSVVYTAVLHFPLSDKTSYHVRQVFEVDMEEHQMDDLFAQIVIDELVPKLRDELPHLFSPDPRAPPVHPDEPFVGTLRGMVVRRSDPDWMEIIQDPAFLMNPNVRIT